MRTLSWKVQRKYGERKLKVEMDIRELLTKAETVGLKAADRKLQELRKRGPYEVAEHANPLDINSQVVSVRKLLDSYGFSWMWLKSTGQNRKLINWIKKNSDSSSYNAWVINYPSIYLSKSYGTGFKLRIGKSTRQEISVNTALQSGAADVLNKAGFNVHVHSRTN